MTTAGRPAGAGPSALIRQVAGNLLKSAATSPALIMSSGKGDRDLWVEHAKRMADMIRIVAPMLELVAESIRESEAKVSGLEEVIRDKDRVILRLSEVLGCDRMDGSDERCDQGFG